MQARSFDEVYLAYAQAVAERRKAQDHYMAALEHVGKCKEDLAAKVELCRELREEVTALTEFAA